MSFSSPKPPPAPKPPPIIEAPGPDLAELARQRTVESRRRRSRASLVIEQSSQSPTLNPGGGLSIPQ